MDGREANLPADHNRIRINPDSNLYRSFNATTSSSSSSSFSSSPPDFLRNVQAAFKRHRMMPQLNNIQPRRLAGPRRETSKSSAPAVDSKTTTESHDVHLSKRVLDSFGQTKNMMSVTAAKHEDASITPPSISGTATKQEIFKSVDAQRSQHCEHVPLVDGLKKVQFALQNNTRSQGSDDQMDTGIDHLLTHMGSLALTEMDWDVSNQVDVSTGLNQDVKQQNFQNLAIDLSLRSNDEMSSLLAKKITGAQNQINPFSNFLQSDFGHHMTQSSVVGSSCATTTLVNSTHAPMLNSTTYCSRAHSGEGFDVNYQPSTGVDMQNRSEANCKSLVDQAVVASLVPSASADTCPEKRHELFKDQQGTEAGDCVMQKDHLPKSANAELVAADADVTDIKSQAPIPNDQFSNIKPIPSKSDKKEKASGIKNASAPRKRNYDPDLFFKVNGKLYQRLGKIGSGGSSEVHKVISQDCTIYALKKIRLKGRDYATAFGFCQEIEYLNKLRGKDHIIQLIDYEVTDKALLKEVMSGSMSNKDGRVKEDGYIYMVLEYGEIDLAHMLSQKWKELDSSQSTIDENWLRFYWQQILLAVNTIHEERIVHSDLKPANFLLVKGSLKLIDFGIAKAIMSDTTNIQRDSQVGTLSYMSPEAFMCNETDANGNIIKCGRPSDIWSLGCILYQMVYGRTPFAEYKTFWAKFKVITDPNHEISYEPLSNPWLLDLMKKCLAWDRNERWRIPQLLQHPFLAPPIPPLVAPQAEPCYRLFELVADSSAKDPKVFMLCSQIQQLLRDPLPHVSSQESVTPDQRRNLLYEVSNLCLQLRDQLANLE